MDEQRMVDYITQEVMKRLKNPVSMAQFSNEKVLIIGAPYPPFHSYYTGACPSDWSAILITRLEPSEMAGLALGIAADEQHRFVLEALLQGKSVYILEDALIYRKFKQTSYKALYQQYLTYEKQLTHFGLQIISDWNHRFEEQPKGNDQILPPIKPVGKNVLTGAMVEQMVHDGIRFIDIPGQTIITPQAKDMIKEYGMVINHQ